MWCVRGHHDDISELKTSNALSIGTATTIDVRTVDSSARSGAPESADGSFTIERLYRRKGGVGDCRAEFSGSRSMWSVVAADHLGFVDLGTVPGPARDSQALRDVVRRIGIAGHGGRGRGEPVVQRLPEAVVRSETGVLEGIVEARDRSLIHLLVLPVAAV
jgi:hypothetical protein